MLAVLPLLAPLATALVTALLARHARAQRAASFAGAVLFVGAALLLVARTAAGEELRVRLGGWAAPLAIEFALDRLAAALVLVTALLGLAALVFQESDADAAPRTPLLLPMLHGLLAGVGAAFATADLFNLYVWLELVLIASLGLLVLGGRPRHLEAAFTYLVLSLLGTLLLLAAVALLYGATGHLGFRGLASAAGRVDPALLVVLLGGLALALLVKAGAFPLFAWLPAAYPTLPAPLLALFAGLLTKVAAYALLRLLGGVFAGPSQPVLTWLGWVAAATMLAGVLGAAHHYDLRRILAFHIISQIGYILLGVALGTEAGHAAAFYYTVHHILVKANLFLIAGVIWRTAGHYDLRRIGGLSARPALALLFLVPAASLVGVPPLSGFWSKYFLLREAFALGHAAWGAVGLVVSFLTLYSMSKVWIEAFWKPHPGPMEAPGLMESPSPAPLGPAYAATIALAIGTLALGFAAEPGLAFARAASAALAAGGGSR